MLVDAHCHLLGSEVENPNPGEVLERARRAGVSGFVVVGTHLEDSRAVLGLARSRNDVAASLGVHPHEAHAWNAETEALLADLLKDSACRFVGEAGLDWHYDFSPRAAQEEAFRAQIRLARLVGKPLMIHTREAREATLAILREEGAEAVRGIIHCFTEDQAFAASALDLGFYLSFSGIVTVRNAEAIRQVAAWAPADRILVETDAPYLAPVPHRGRRNEPAYVVHVAEAVARLRGMSPQALAEQTTRNLEDLCGWSPSC